MENQKSINRKENAKQRYSRLRGLGYPCHVCMLLRYWSDKRIDEFVKKNKPEDLEL
ncbi:MAG: hypothetical protein ACLFVB_10300 [Thermoplasmata archaeon]